MKTLFTIGHSTHDTETFIGLLKQHGVTAVCDVRSSPYSKFNPQFNRETLQVVLKQHRIAYVYLGKELGPRSKDPDCYENGRASYEKIARTALFQEGLQRLKDGMKQYTIALMCAEKDPVTCHRMILICRHMPAEEAQIAHILEDGALENNTDAERRLMKILKIPELQLFDTPEALVQKAYGVQGEKIAYAIDADAESGEASLP